MLQSILKGFAKRCTATAKSTKQQCQCPAAYGCSTCRVHGARRPETIVKGKDCHFYKHGQSTRQKRREAPTKLKKAKEEIKLCVALLNSDEPVFCLPFDDKKADELNLEMEKIAKKFVTGVAKFTNRANKTASKKSPVTGEIK